MFNENLRVKPDYLPKNLFVEYFNELELNWAVDLNEADVLTSFHHYASIHEKLLTKGIEPSFDLSEKEQARDYLLARCK